MTCSGLVETHAVLGNRQRGVLPTEGKTRITMYLDDVVLERFKALSEKSGKGYQTLINEALRAHLGVDETPLTATAVAFLEVTP